MEHVLWIGGPPGAGKTTIATLLARRHGLRLYSADTRTWEHRDRAIAAGSAAARRWEALTPAARWDGSTPDLLDMSLHRERGAMVLDDVRALPRSPLVIAEGSTVPASAIASGDADAARAIWLLPSAAHQAVILAAAGTAPGPARLYAHLRDVIAAEAAEHRAPVLPVDDDSSVSDTFAAVEEHFAGTLATGPRAATIEQRRALLREINVHIVEQVHGYYARPWAAGTAAEVSRTFVCECGDPACTADVDVTVGEAAAQPVLAPHARHHLAP